VFANEDCNKVSRGKQVQVILCRCTNPVIARLLIASVAHLRADDRRVSHRWNGEYKEKMRRLLP